MLNRNDVVKLQDGRLARVVNTEAVPVRFEGKTYNDKKSFDLVPLDQIKIICLTA